MLLLDFVIIYYLHKSFKDSKKKNKNNNNNNNNNKNNKIPKTSNEFLINIIFERSYCCKIKHIHQRFNSTAVY